MQRKRFKLPIRWPFLLALVFGLIAIWQYQAIHDWLSLRNYDPPASVVQLADDIRLTPQTRRVFYVNHPAIADRSSFNTSCSNKGEHTIVLGCYHPVDRGIFIFQVSDVRLRGVDQVTAAHEVLHATYDRLSNHERTRVDGMLQNYYSHDMHDERIEAIVAAYRKSEPDAVVNEMHSIFATEIASLPDDLEQYYKQYFQDRSRVVQYASTYQAEFTSRQLRVTEDDARLKVLKQQIEANTTSLDTQEAEITALRKRLDSDRAADNIQAYNSNVPIYNAKIEVYNNAIHAARAQIASYNQLVVERNDLALQVTELAHSIDSSFQPISQ